ncbi:thioredoxin domain-containing protein [Gemmatimonadota bacterium]
MERSLTLSGISIPRILSFLAGVGMIVASVLTIDHYFSANFPETIWEGSFCDINAFFNCDSSAFALISQFRGVPLGYFGLIVGALVSLGALFPSPGFERSNKTISLLNVTGVVVLLLYSVFVLGSLCLLCSGFYLFSIISFFLFWRYGIDGDGRGFLGKWVRPSLLHLATFAVVTAVGAFGLSVFHDAKEDAQTGGVASRIVDQYFGLPEVPLPSFLSPLWSVRSTEEFQDAPVQIVEYGDLLCPDCKFLADQIHRLAEDFPGKINVAYQLFPLEGICNDVVEKDLHPGACETSYLAAHDPEKFKVIHDEIWDAWPAPRQETWRQELAQRHGVEAGLTDPQTQALVQRMIQTGKEYEKTSDEYAHGIRSTPTMILNGRMVIGTLPYDQLRAIVEAIITQAEGGDRFIESWERR